MIRRAKRIYIDVNRGKNSISITSERFQRANLQFFEGDSVVLNIYFRDYSKKENITLGDEDSILLSVATEDSLKSVGNSYITISEQFDQKTDSDGIVYYEGLLNLNTQEAINVLENTNGAKGVLEIVIVQTSLGRQTTYQGDITITRSIAPATVQELLKPSLHIGSYASAREMMEEVADKRILDLKDGAPLEFDTLYELAHYAQKVKSHEIVVGDFCDYLDGKKLVDQNLTVVSLGNIMIDSSTYAVSHEPWRPKEVTAVIKQ